MVQLKGDIPLRAMTFIKNEIQRIRGRERTDKVWTLKEVVNVNDKKKNPVFVFEYKTRTRPNGTVSRKRIVETVRVQVSRKFLRWSCD